MGLLTRIGRVLSVPFRPSVWKQVLAPVDNRGWFQIIRESYAGAWQQNVEVNVDSVLAYHAVFSCITLAAADVGKLRQTLKEKDSDGIWSETESPAFSPVLKKPNRYQTHIQFKETWITSKMTRGNTYALKQRDERKVVTALYILDPTRVTPLVSSSGDIYYKLSADNLVGLTEEDGGIVVPASEIIHDRMNCLFHPLVGLSPIFACGLAATQGLRIQNNSALFFGNMSRPSGVLIAPGPIDDANATRLKEYWDTNFSGNNFGKVAILGDGLKYEAMSVNAEEAQLIEQLKWTAEVVCSCFHMPPFKIHVGTAPTYQNAEILNQIYYTDCLQSLIESYETCLDEGLGLDKKIDGKQLGVELDLDGLLRMDMPTQIKTLREGVAGAILSPNEARAKLDRKPVAGGGSPMSQQQNYSLAALAKRDAQEDPFASVKPPPQSAPKSAPTPEEEAEAGENDLKNFREALNRGLLCVKQDLAAIS